MIYDFSNSGNAKRRIVCMLMAAFFVLALLVPAGMNIFAKDSGYKHLSFELHPDDEDPDKTVTLEGVMPKNASAEVLDVTDDYVNDTEDATPADSSRDDADSEDTNVKNAENENADNTIIDGGKNDVENNDSEDDANDKNDSAITDSDKTGDNKSEDVDRENAENKIDDAGKNDSVKADKSITKNRSYNNASDDADDETASAGDADSAAEISNENNEENNGGSYETATGTDADNNDEKTTDDNTAVSGDETVDGETVDDETVGDETTDGEPADDETVDESQDDDKPETDDGSATPQDSEKEDPDDNEQTDDEQQDENDGPSYETLAAYDITIKVGKKEYQPTEERPIRVEITDSRITIDKNIILYHIKDSGEKEEITDITIEDGKISFDATGFSVYEIVNVLSSTDVSTLNGKTYGLMHYSGGTHGYALMANGGVHSLIEIVTRQLENSNNRVTLYVDEGSEITKWTFTATEGGKFILSAPTENGTGYLAADGSKLKMVSTVGEASEFTINAGSDRRIQLVTDGKYVTFTTVDDGKTSVTTVSLAAASSANTWLNFVDTAAMDNKDLITYSADRVSVSDVHTRDKVIVYTRVWNEDEKKYDIYAVDHDGSLYLCYASGGKILWLGDGTCSLEWEFTEYLDEVTKLPNYYYELYNPYSEKYLAPQLTDQILADSKKGINMQGRRNGEFYSEIICWDDDHYAYVGMKPNETNKKLVPCSRSNCAPFYFATLEELNLDDRLHEVETLDNISYGITIKMQDFKDRNSMSGPLGNNAGGATELTQPNILSTKLGSDGYPVVTARNKSLAELYNNTTIVNHLFIKSIHEASGYFEFDSCQNFATLCKDNDKQLKDLVTYTDATGNTYQVRDFTVYRELGTTDNNTGNESYTRKHGQFLPYNNIVNKSISFHKNTYSALTDVRGTKGELPETDPRKYEKMYNVSNTPNYYNGMELEASFVQTASGLDSWGHDMIFEFTGDDDFWLYVDGELVIDLGGIHSALEGWVNFKTGEVYVNGRTTTLKQIFIDNFTTRYKAENNGASPSKQEIMDYLGEYFQPAPGASYGYEDIFADYSNHTMRIFYMERGAGASNLHMRFNLASVTPGKVVVSKTLKDTEGNDITNLDTDFLEYPFQIYYTLPEGPNGEPGEEHLLGNDDEHIRVTYQNSNQSATYLRRYRPPGFSEAQAYENIYLINPTRNAEISFPDNTITYRIVECAVDSTVYPSVLINGNPVPESQIEYRGDLRSYSSETSSAEVKPTISFDNYINDNVIKELHIKKELRDENDQLITDDPATFSFRLYISSVEVPTEDIPRANMYNYYVVSPNNKICRYDPVSKGFAETSLEYSPSNVKAVKDGNVEGLTVDDITFQTSGFGAISNIPSGYEIVVPGLPVGTVFKVTEDIKPGYGLDHYQKEEGYKILDDETVVQVPSYGTYENNPDNVGQVILDANPQMTVVNKRGYGLNVKKKWSDLSLTTYHDPVYVAVYVDGELLPGSVRQIASPATTAYYFWETLKPNADESERTTLDGYVVKEVTVSGTPTIAEDGTVTGDYTVSPLVDNKINLLVTRTEEATPEGEESDTHYDYVVSYKQGVFDGSTRTDTITNTREGGIALRLFKWDSSDPLAGGKFTLKDSSDNKLGEFTSDSEGLINLFYDYVPDELYTLVQNSAPPGYVGLQKTLVFKVNADETVSLYNEDGTTEWGTIDSTDNKWADWKNGEKGITAFVDVYNKPFNFKIMKMDSKDDSLKLGNAHFALYKQSNTSVSGYVKYKYPMTGFEDMATVNGEVDICGGNSNRVINPGANGSVYFLTETRAPSGYNTLEDDIIFRISPLGVPSLISDSYNGQLQQVETNDSYIYTLSVPNTKREDDRVFLTITKKVAGNQGNKKEKFTFFFVVEEDADPAGYDWIKNGVEMTTSLKSGQSFTIGHDDVVIIKLPPGKLVTITEEETHYTTTMKLDNGMTQTEETRTGKTFTVDEDTTLTVTNTRQGVIPTGIETCVFELIGLSILFILMIILFIRCKNRYCEEE